MLLGIPAGPRCREGWGPDGAKQQPPNRDARTSAAADIPAAEGMAPTLLDSEGVSRALTGGLQEAPCTALGLGTVRWPASWPGAHPAPSPGWGSLLIAPV